MVKVKRISDRNSSAKVIYNYQKELDNNEGVVVPPLARETPANPIAKMR